VAIREPVVGSILMRLAWEYWELELRLDCSTARIYPFWSTATAAG
jgi:hypothetical protein